ncbi:response regulator [uncultured Maricaulis sp.]|uniref:response regulator n=1 Tax=uncultured Maricaulis sp. TaxID=174710 RepID=UPI0030DD43C3|tara:strand:- start:15637 stop:16467 length:831 start_codon:yes stop_codon:yes gene_type:complete
MSAAQITFADPANEPPATRDWGRQPALVLHSNSFMRNLVIGLLRDAGVRDILVATQAGAALRLMQESAPALVVADWSDHSDATEDRVKLLQRIRTSGHSEYRDTPIILLSSPRSRPEIERARDAGASEFLITPLAPITMINRLKSMRAQPRTFIEASRFTGPDRRRRPRPKMGPSLKRVVDVETGRTTSMAAARSAAVALAHETKLTGDPLAIRVGRSLQRFIASLSSYTPVEAEVVEMHRAALAQLVRMAEAGNPLRDPVVSGLEQIVTQRLQAR